MDGTFITYIILLLAIAFLVMLARKLNVSYPIVLVLGGLAIGFIPQLPVVEVDPDLIFVPLIAIDSRGTRLGRGKGHYDRALGRLKKSGARLIGVGWQMQKIDTPIPADPWDVPLHAFASPDGVELFS